eukprot:TRINITY_DN37876_c0_g1_i2.p1 TRINITY_DN37876_c0_g1~~TRINITY_DN37876_c0_g1_i2.p1  ORF type:complete len:487 (+),score=72.78 TRINITY_DN37876_c0_g1_i2:108-1463(+)
MASSTDDATTARGMKRTLEERAESTPEDPIAKQRRQSQISIVLTGGPCSGKSSVLALIRDRLSKRGFQVVTVPEYATHFFANSDGFQGEWVATDKEKELQRVLLRYQIMQEDLFKDYAALNSKPSVLLLDRGCLDQKVFVSSEDVWTSALTSCAVTEKELLDRYDMVMHLATCAKVGEYEWGPGSNNPGRYHTPEEAAKLDKTCEEAYRNHKQLRMVPHCPKFEDKVEQVMGYLEDALGVDGLQGKRHRVEVKLSAEEVPVEVLEKAQAFEITSAFLDKAMHLSVRRRHRVPVEKWSKGLKNGQDTSGAHEKGDLDSTFEERRSIPDEDFLARRAITETAYNSALQIAPHSSVDKHVLSFQTGGSLHYELLYFQGGQNSASGSKLLLDCTVGSPLPDWLHEVSPAGAEVCKKRIESETPKRVLQRNSTAEAASKRILKRNSTAEAASEAGA